MCKKSRYESRRRRRRPPYISRVAPCALVRFCALLSCAPTIVCVCSLKSKRTHKKASSKNVPPFRSKFVRSFPSSNCVNVRSQREIYLGFNTSSQFFFEARERERETKSSLSFFGSAFTRLSLSLSLSRLLLTRHDTERGRTSRRGRLEERARGTFIARVQCLHVFVVASSFFCADKRRTRIHRHTDTHLSLIRLDGIVSHRSHRESRRCAALEQRDTTTTTKEKQRRNSRSSGTVGDRLSSRCPPLSARRRRMSHSSRKNARG